MKTAYLAFYPCENNHRTDENFRNIGNNTGNIVFDHALSHLFKAEIISTNQLEENVWKYNKLIVRDFIWIQEDADMSYFRGIMKTFSGSGKRIIPISVGLQASEYKKDFKLNKNTETILAELAEQSKLAIRGEYSAGILNKLGIKNLQVIGCPSLYEGGYGFRVYNDAGNLSAQDAVSNYRTLSNTLDTAGDKQALEYLARNTAHFVDQNRCYFSRNVIEKMPKIVQEKILNEKKIFFIYEDWQKFLGKFKFCIGARFHGNVMAVLSGVPALFLTFDSRIREMTDFFHLPSIALSEFDVHKSMMYWYEKADYTEFNKKYDEKMDRFIAFCFENGLELKEGSEMFFWRKGYNHPIEAKL